MAIAGAAISVLASIVMGAFWAHYARTTKRLDEIEAKVQGLSTALATVPSGDQFRVLVAALAEAKSTSAERATKLDGLVAAMPTMSAISDGVRGVVDARVARLEAQMDELAKANHAHALALAKLEAREEARIGKGVKG